MWFFKLSNQFDENVEYHIIKIRVKNKVKYKRIQPLVAHGQVQCRPSPLLCLCGSAALCTEYALLSSGLCTPEYMGRDELCDTKLIDLREHARPNHQMASWCSVPYEALDAKVNTTMMQAATCREQRNGAAELIGRHAMCWFLGSCGQLHPYLQTTSVDWNKLLL